MTKRVAGGGVGGVSPIRTFEDLECWRACRLVRQFVRREIVAALPGEERFLLGDQLIRASRSVTANIAEGYGRFHHLENAKFCSNARGSLFEVLDHLITASDDGLIPADLLEQGRALVLGAVKVLNGYTAYLKRAAAGQ